MKKITFLISGDINLILKNYRPFFKKLEKESIIKIIDVADLKIGKKNKYRNIRYKNISFEYLRIKTFKKFSKFVENNKEETLKRLTPAHVSGTLKIAVGRIRKMSLGDKYLNCFTVGDQLLWGAAEPLRRFLRIYLEL